MEVVQGPPDPKEQAEKPGQTGQDSDLNDRYTGSDGTVVTGPEDPHTNPDQPRKEITTSAAGSRPTAPPTVPAPRQAALFPKTVGRPPEAVRIVLDSLHASGHPDATVEEARAVHRAVVAQYGTKVTPNYLRGISNGSGFGGYYAPVRADRALRVEAALKQIRKTEPPCEHGTPAGRATHPSNGAVLCPECRSGVAVRDEPTHGGTDPSITAALDAYRRAHPGALRTALLLELTRQAAALHKAGATADQLAALGTYAGQAGIGLLEAVQQRRTP